MKIEHVAVCDNCGKEEVVITVGNKASGNEEAMNHFRDNGWTAEGNKAYCIKCNN